MRNTIFAAAIAAAAAGLLSATAMADGPRASSEDYIPPSPPITAPVGQAGAATLGPRASSEAHIAPSPTTVAAPAGAPHYVWQGGYVHGKWRGQWVLVR